MIPECISSLLTDIRLHQLSAELERSQETIRLISAELEAGTEREASLTAQLHFMKDQYQNLHSLQCFKPEKAKICSESPNTHLKEALKERDIRIEALQDQNKNWQS